MAISRENITDWRGRELASSDGSKLGRIEEIYLDTETNEPEFALIHTGLFGTKQTFVPLRDASPAGDQLQVPYDKSQVKDAPSIEPDGKMSQSEEAELYRHYGLGYSETRSGSGLPEGGTGTDRFTREGAGAPPVGEDVSGPETDDAMTRSEEELRVGKAERESGRVRLRKHVVTDQATKTVPVKREEIRIEREPITGGNVDDALDGPEISEEEHEVVLHEEEVVTEKRVVPKERVRLGKDVEVDERTVSEDVRREEIEVDDDALRRDR
jgi:uncharacterized protein (TIGR02271 family)